MKGIIFIFSLLCFSFCNVYGQENLWELTSAVPANVKVTTDLVYGQGGGKELLLDLYLPDDSIRSGSAIIFIHGGGWSGGNKEMYRKYAYYFASKGMVCTSINYRLSGEALFPAAIEDCKCAIRWLRANAVKFKVNPNKIAVAGGSAGGHLVALAGTSSGIKELEGEGGYPEFSSRPDLVIAFFGVFDFNVLDNSDKNKPALGPVTEFIGGTKKQFPGKYRLASPIGHIDPSDPPFLLFHGTGDTIVLYEQSVEFKEALEKKGVPVQLSTTPGGIHGYVHSSPYFEATISQMKEYIDYYFK